jgi:hypothetical protein
MLGEGDDIRGMLGPGSSAVNRSFPFHPFATSRDFAEGRNIRGLDSIARLASCPQRTSRYSVSSPVSQSTDLPNSPLLCAF